MVEAGAEAATDVTGYGLLGHLHFMLAASGVAAEVDAGAIPMLEGTVGLAERGVVPAGLSEESRLPRGARRSGASSAEPEQLVLADAQTSGGLLIAAS